jgi:hypothetical protein
MIPAIEGLLDEPYNGRILTLLYRLAEWHALAKLRMHTEHTLEYLDRATTKLGHELRTFRDWTEEAYSCQELPGETDARNRRRQRKAKKDYKRTDGGTSKAHKEAESNTGVTTKARAKPKAKMFNLFIYKFHALGDYVRTIRLFGTTDSYSTQIVNQSLYLVLSCSILIHTGRTCPSIREAVIRPDKQKQCHQTNRKE